MADEAGEQGTLLIIKNYSGDVMNFKNAVRLAREDQIQTDYVIVDDDVAVKDSLYTVGRRGVAGTVLVHKIAGAAAERGYDLKRVKEAAENAVRNTRSIGFALSSCTVPAKGTPTFDIGSNEMEYGVGIHGESGIQREAVRSADELAKRMVASLTDELDVKETDEVTVLVNGFGGTPLQELYLFTNSAAKVLAEQNVRIYRVFTGNYMTSIDMSDASLTLMKMDRELKELLDQECDAPAFHVNGPVAARQYESFEAGAAEENGDLFGIRTDKKYARIRDGKITLQNVIFMVDVMGECIIKNEVPFCELDAHAGDGDFLNACSLVIMEYCGGASGPVWGSAFRAAGKSTQGKKELGAEEFARLLQSAVTGVQKTGEYSFGRGAVVGDKTLIDALVPCADTWTEFSSKHMKLRELFLLSAEEAVNGAKETASIAARMGRAGTVGKRSIGYPDAGAFALGVIFTEISNALDFDGV